MSALVNAGRGASLLVIGSHGRHGLSRFLLGSVSHDVIVHAPCPVMVLRIADRR
jgi:nucleotide-binding universal stress UspA family protein